MNFSGKSDPVRTLSRSTAIYDHATEQSVPTHNREQKKNQQLTRETRSNLLSQSTFFCPPTNPAPSSVNHAAPRTKAAKLALFPSSFPVPLSLLTKYASASSTFIAVAVGGRTAGGAAGRGVPATSACRRREIVNWTLVGEAENSGGSGGLDRGRKEVGQWRKRGREGWKRTLLSIQGLASCPSFCR